VNTLLLDLTNWDLLSDANGNIAMASAPYSIAQDVASALRTFLGEVYYDVSIGISYWQSILGYLPPVALIKTQLISAALTVPGVISAQCFLQAIGADRVLSGQVQITVAAVATATTAPTAGPTPPAPTTLYSLNFSLGQNSMYVVLGII